MSPRHERPSGVGSLGGRAAWLLKGDVASDCCYEPVAVLRSWHLGRLGGVCR
jgi:hypothetical protein